MDEIYKVIQIERKGFGCIALKNIKKGTLILQEKPQFIAKNVCQNMVGINGLVESFNCMSQINQEEYLKLHNRYKNLDEKDIQNLNWMSWIESNFDDQIMVKHVKNIVGIFNTNKFESGVGIKSSRFNHSCSSNAEQMWNTSEEFREIRSVSKIKAGDEITINYGLRHTSMKKIKIRQTFLSNWGFLCECDLCKEETNKCDDEIYEKFENLKQEAYNLLNLSNQPGGFQYENTKKEIICYKEMYKLAKVKNTSKTLIVKEILEDGFNAAVQGYIYSRMSFDNKHMQEFKHACVIFSNVGEQISVMVFGTKHNISKEWTKRRFNFEKWIEEKIYKKQFKTFS